MSETTAQPQPTPYETGYRAVRAARPLTDRLARHYDTLILARLVELLNDSQARETIDFVAGDEGNHGDVALSLATMFVESERRGDGA